MKGLTKKVIAIIVCALIIGVIAILPGFAETQEQLEQVFVKREDVGKWVKYAEDKLKWAESVSNWKIYRECSKEMSTRGVEDKNQSLPATEKPSESYNPGAYVWP